jgi:hypothetical protein
VVATVLRLYHLGAQSLWIDEVFSVTSAGVGGSLSARDLLENVHGPLYSLILHLAGRGPAASEWALRLPSALAGIALVPALTWLAAGWVGREAAIAAAWLAALSPFLVWYSQEARNYMPLILCVCLAALALVALARAFRPGLALAAIAATGAGLLSNLSFVLLAPLEARWWWRARPDWRWTLGAALALALLLAPWALQALRIWDFQRLQPGAAAAGEPLRGATTFHVAAVPFALHAFAVGYTLGPSLRELRVGPPAAAIARHRPELVAVALVFGALLLLGVRALARRGRLVDLALWTLVPALVVSYFALRNFKVFHPRYLAVATPAFLLTLAAAFADLGPRARAAFAIAVLVLWGASLQHHYFDPRYGKEDYRGAAALVRARGEAGEKLLALGAPEPVFHYYRGPLEAAPFWLGYAAGPDRLEAALGKALRGTRGAWLVLSRPEDLDPGDAFARWMGERFPEAQRFALEGVRIWHLDRGEVARLAAGSER